VSWSLLTVHRIPTIALQFMRGFCHGKQRPLTLNTTKKNAVCNVLDFRIWKMATIWFELYDPNQEYF